jgi:hypothetical protein
MPSHGAHRICGRSIGLPEHVLGFIDRLIDDERRCGVHDIGLEVLSVMLSRRLNIGVALDHGLSTLMECLKDYGALDEVHLNAAALHFLLDCVNRNMPYFGTQRAREESEAFLYYCAEKLEEKWRTQMYRYFYFNAEMVEPYIEDMVRRIRSLIENHKGVLAECVDMVAYEREVKARMKDGVKALPWVERGWGSIVEMLKHLCVKRNVRQVLYVNWQPLPVVAAARKVESLLRKGETVTIMTEDRGVVITAGSLEELRSKIAQLLVEG